MSAACRQAAEDAADVDADPVDGARDGALRREARSTTAQQDRDSLIEFIDAHDFDQGRRAGDKVEQLREQRKRLQTERSELTRKLRNEKRKRSRLVNRSSKMTTADLVEVLDMRRSRAAAKACAFRGLN